ncbi:MAG: hypothetical protein OXQ29_02495 [Rhodospirillaceae bacterium]|nr:hypothetical protein [Rhodospirillaceae bacterium]
MRNRVAQSLIAQLFRFEYEFKRPGAVDQVLEEQGTLALFQLV